MAENLKQDPQRDLVWVRIKPGEIVGAGIASKEL